MNLGNTVSEIEDCLECTTFGMKIAFRLLKKYVSMNVCSMNEIQMYNIHHMSCDPWASVALLHKSFPVDSWCSSDAHLSSHPDTFCLLFYEYYGFEYTTQLI